MNSETDGSTNHVDRKYCRTCGWVVAERGFHPEYGPKDHCPKGGFDHVLFDTKQRMINHDHEAALWKHDEERMLEDIQ